MANISLGTIVQYFKNVSDWVKGTGTTIPTIKTTSVIKTTPITGVKTVTFTPAEIFAGANRLASRRKIVMKNESSDIRIRIGSASVTVDNGFPVEPGAVMSFDFDPEADVALFAISEAGNVQITVMEI